jgi:hypothetical protein
MKRLFQWALLALAISGCDIYVVEPAYDSRDRITGHYDAEEYSETYNDLIFYSIYIVKAATRDRVYIDNFYGSDMRVLAMVDYDRITIPYQVVDGYEIEGVGTFYGHYLSLTYRVKDIYSNSYTDFCETEATRY